MQMHRKAILTAILSTALTATSVYAANHTTMDRGMSPSMDRSRMGAGMGVGHMDSQTIRQVQEALRDKGYNPGPVDGMMGPRTHSALRSYQRAENLTGARGLDQRTLDSLGVQASSGTGDMGGSSASRASPGAVTPFPTAGGNSAEPARTGKVPLPRQRVEAGKPAVEPAQPTAGGNSARPTAADKSGAPLGATPGRDSTANPKYPSAGGNSASSDHPARTSEVPNKK